jgi:tetrahydromethanopterin S-methyltransferase subunit F
MVCDDVAFLDGIIAQNFNHSNVLIQDATWHSKRNKSCLIARDCVIFSGLMKDLWA